MSLRKLLTGLFCCQFFVMTATGFSGRPGHSAYVNPFIGTGRADSRSFWGSEGGTYPGAVAPWGFVQLTPETDIGPARGYNYRDTSIYFFSCTGHMSGYPNGSSGDIHLMPVRPDISAGIKYSGRRFLHSDEQAGAGYYSVKFRDDGTLAEATASARTGMFRFTFPEGAPPVLSLSDAGTIEQISPGILHGSRLYSVFRFSSDITGIKQAGDGVELYFKAEQGKETVLTVVLSVSQTGYSSSGQNIIKEAGNLTFDEFLKMNRENWEAALSVIDINDPSETDKTTFYTALYHSMLLPWIISDTEGSYMGADMKTYRTTGQAQYSAFSPWDTFRTLHPLLCLIAPERQNDMIISALDYFRQKGRLPGGPMTGNHIIAIIADTWSKGIRGFDASEALAAMGATLDSSSSKPDMAEYLKRGYVPATYGESVTRTVEYAYNDWIFGNFTSEVTGAKDIAAKFLERSYGYRKLIDTNGLYLVPRNDEGLIREPGFFGYKEGDKHSYSFFVPHHPVDLVNMSGGTKVFSARLDSLLSENTVLFDNEPVLHVPYLFNYSMRPDETQKWVRKIMASCYSARPGGLPGNDDLGSMSSWFVFSAMGLCPVCPGKPYYDLGAPLFSELTLHLPGKRDVRISAQGNVKNDNYVKAVFINGRKAGRPWISHNDLTGGGHIVFETARQPQPTYGDFSQDPILREEGGFSDIRVTGFELPVRETTPGRSFMVRFTAVNSGSPGAKKVVLYVDGKENSGKIVMAGRNSTVRDSVECTLFRVGSCIVSIDKLGGEKIMVTDPGKTSTKRFEILNAEATQVLKKGSAGSYAYQVMNLSGWTGKAQVNIFLNDSLIRTDRITVEPGERKTVRHGITLQHAGTYNLRIDTVVLRIKAWDSAPGSDVISIKINPGQPAGVVPDRSGFSNNGIAVCGGTDLGVPGEYFRTGEKGYIEFSNAPSLDKPGEKITVMGWVRPGAGNRGLADIMTKGDFIALQSFGNRSLSFFAGGWGRGSCEAELPGGWVGNWHHIAGVSTGEELKIYIDGEEKGKFFTGKPVSLSVCSRWMLGRNEEFPGERTFNSEFGSFNVFTEALSASEIAVMMKMTEPSGNSHYTTLNAHSHNDYSNDIPFWLAYYNHFGSIEADIWAVNGILYVAHDSSGIDPANTLEAMYIQPAVRLFRHNGGKAWYDQPSAFQLLIDLKTPAEPTLGLLVKMLEKYPDVFDPGKNSRAIRVVISGNRPLPSEFHRYPGFIYFDGVIGMSYDADQLKRVPLFSEDLGNYTGWTGHGTIPASDSERLSKIIKDIHGLGCSIRFWAAPDDRSAWQELMDLGVDYINTDHIDELAEFVNKNKIIKKQY